eukprot:CAMPEP_0194193070 /NCGR_PEP_ID=MMETSP0154-20130528/73233_1 /TAXON_ID=1049557 /ORGANISM="Thalassiothrix antarctica, Strain L6-D1" /LENGTH=38 /DNA_ID= /DNA_START= /DNA_END= /DNA_ORIENTATION=
MTCGLLSLVMVIVLSSSYAIVMPLIDTDFLISDAIELR